MKISCLNPIAAVGMQLFTDAYEKVDDFATSDAALVRSASGTAGSAVGDCQSRCRCQ